MGSLRAQAMGITAAATMLVCANAQAASPVSRRPGRFEAKPSFTITYVGSGWFQTTYHSTPPNPGGQSDTNDAHDASTQRWSLTFSQPLGVPRCRSTRPCPWPATVSGATGATMVTGRINHRHIDGLFAADNRLLRCRVAFRTAHDLPLHATVELRYRAARQTLSITTLDPVTDAVTDAPQQCPAQGDSIDGLYDNYFTPGFSFATGFGPDRWFRSATVTVPLRELRRSSRLRISLHQTRSGTPPRGCRVPARAYERCTAIGGWSGALELRRR